MSKSETVELKGLLQHETPAAIFFDNVWLPKTLIEFEVDNTGKKATVRLPEWLAKDKGLI